MPDNWGEPPKRAATVTKGPRPVLSILSSLLGGASGERLDAPPPVSAAWLLWAWSLTELDDRDNGGNNNCAKDILFRMASALGHLKLFREEESRTYLAQIDDDILEMNMELEIDTESEYEYERVFGLYAIQDGQRATLIWSQADEDWETGELDRGFDFASISGDLSILDWARKNASNWDKVTCECAASGGHFDVLKWAIASGCRLDARTCEAAASGGHFDCLEYAHANGCPWNKSACARAAEGGHWAILQWLRSEGCPWD